ncbi:MAG: hypothetical protein GX859_02070, partial [Corynebacterium humireducens]|nr:hypothetical protein [Corynebacterium humireducens]
TLHKNFYQKNQAGKPKPNQKQTTSTPPQTVMMKMIVQNDDSQAPPQQPHAGTGDMSATRPPLPTRKKIGDRKKFTAMIMSAPQQLTPDTLVRIISSGTLS